MKRQLSVDEQISTRKKRNVCEKQSQITPPSSPINKKRKCISPYKRESKCTEGRALCKRQLERRFINKGYFYTEEIEYIH